MNFLALHNFRVFSGSQLFQFAPLTLLTGPNNSGKSSVLKALLLLKENFKDGFYLTDSIENLSFQNGLHKLGAFDSCINKNSTKKIISFAIPFDCLHQTDKLVLTYGRKNNKINNGELLELKALSYDSENDGENELFSLIPEINGMGFTYKINYDMFYRVLSLHSKMESQIAKEQLFLNSKPFNYQKLIDPKKRKYSFKKSLFKYDFVSDNKKSINNKTADKQLLNAVSESNFYQYHPEGDHPMIKCLLDQVYKNYRGESGRSTMQYNKIKEKYSIKKIHPTENGKLFFEEIQEFIRKSFENLFYKFEQIVYLNSDKVDQRRIYFDTQNTIFTKLLIEYHDTYGNEKHSFINKWLFEFGILKKNESIDFKRIADSAFELSIINLKDKTVPGVNLADYGFGVTQLLALLLRFTSKGRKIYLIEEPETNLHPNLQSKLADLFVDVIQKYQARFIIETHSEYLIRKLQFLVATSYSSNQNAHKVSLNKNDVKVYYFNNTDYKGNQVELIEINSDGRLTQEFGSGFLDESTKIIFDIWNLPGQN